MSKQSLLVIVTASKLASIVAKISRLGVIVSDYTCLNTIIL